MESFLFVFKIIGLQYRKYCISPKGKHYSIDKWDSSRHVSGLKGKEREKEKEMSRKRRQYRGNRVDDCICYHQ